MDRVVIREDISKGHRVRGWELAANIGGQWLLSSNGTGVGNRFTAVFDKALPVRRLGSRASDIDTSLEHEMF